jgi:hypothetical protein
MTEPLVVAPKKAFDMIGVGNTKGYELLNSGEIESITIGRARRVIVPSLKAYVARRLAEQEAA